MNNYVYISYKTKNKIHDSTVDTRRQWQCYTDLVQLYHENIIAESSFQAPYKNSLNTV